jgi:hypothetical protein
MKQPYNTRLRQGNKYKFTAAPNNTPWFKNKPL